MPRPVEVNAPPLAVPKNRFVNVPVVEKREVEVALVVVELTAVKF